MNNFVEYGSNCSYSLIRKENEELFLNFIEKNPKKIIENFYFSY